MLGIIYKNIKLVCCTPETNIVSKSYFHKKVKNPKTIKGTFYF